MWISQHMSKHIRAKMMMEAKLDVCGLKFSDVNWLYQTMWTLSKSDNLIWHSVCVQLIFFFLMHFIKVTMTATANSIFICRLTSNLILEQVSELASFLYSRYKHLLDLKAFCKRKLLRKHFWILIHCRRTVDFRLCWLR